MTHKRPERARIRNQYEVCRDRLVPMIGAQRWLAAVDGARRAYSNWLEPLVAVAQGRSGAESQRLRRGIWVRYVGRPGELQRHVATGTYGQVFSPERYMVLFDNERAPLVTPLHLMEIVPAPPVGHRRWHLRCTKRQWKAIVRARQVWGEGYEPSQLGCA